MPFAFTANAVRQLQYECHTWLSVPARFSRAVWQRASMCFINPVECTCSPPPERPIFAAENISRFEQSHRLQVVSIARVHDASLSRLRGRAHCGQQCVKTPCRPKTKAKSSFLCLIYSGELSGEAFSSVPLASLTTWGCVYKTFANSWRLCDSNTIYSMSWFVSL